MPRRERRKRSRARRVGSTIVVVFVVVLLAIVTALLSILYVPAASRLVLGRAVSWYAGNVPGDVRVGAFEGAIARGVRLHDVRLEDARGRPVASARLLRIRLRAWPLLLARAGLLRDRRCTIHFEHRPALVEAFPDLDVTGSLFEIDRDRCTASGGTATLDLMLALITERHGRALAAAVGEWFLHTQLRLPGAQQRSSLHYRYDISNPALLRALERMEASIEEPLAREALARVARVSVRQLERLFAAQLGRTMGTHYRALRLDRARALLQETTMPVLQVAMAAGFVSAAHFTRAYRAQFGHPPRAERQRAQAQR